jgi:hypothetical protein
MRQPWGLLMKNPFKYNVLVTGNDFCDRENDIQELVEKIENSVNVLLFSRRRYGKTSLIFEIFTHHLDENFVRVYVDLFGINNEYDFLKRVAKGISASNLKKGIKARFKELGKIFKRINFSLGLDQDGQPVFKPEIKQSDFDECFDELFDNFAAYLEGQGRQACFVFDEFQQIREIGQPSLEACLRTKIQFHTHIAYVFTGSKTHILTDIFIDTRKPFYSLADPRELKPIPEHKFYLFCAQRFQRAKKELSEDAFALIYKLARGETRFVQKVCHYLFNEKVKAIGQDDIYKVIQKMNLENDAPFKMLMQTLTANQRLALKILAEEQKNLFSTSICSKYSIAPQSLRAALNSLMDKMLVYRDDQQYKIYDVELEHWLASQA